MIVCVSGASGFIGGKLVEHLLNSNNQVRYLSRTRDKQPIPKANLFIGDVNSPINHLLQYFNNTGAFYHCAGETNDESVMQSTHVIGTANLLNVVQELHFKNNGIFHWVQLSSCGAYGVNSLSQSSVSINEQNPTNPNNTYETTKTHADMLIVEFAARNPWFKYTIIRPSIVFGLGMKSNAIKSMAKLLKLRLFISIEKDSIANYVHVDDVVSAMLLSMMNEKAFNKTFIVSSDCNMSDFVHAICKGLGIGKPLLSINISLINFFASVLDLINLGNPIRKKSEVLNRKVSFSNAYIKKELGWEPSDVRSKVSEYIKSVI